MCVSAPIGSSPLKYSEGKRLTSRGSCSIRPPARPVAEGPTAEHGAYVANMCKGCHGLTLTGGPIPGGPPDWPPAADLTAAKLYAAYDSVDKFRTMLRSGKRPTGEAIKVMPFPSLGALNDTDVEALYSYLRSLPKPVASR